MTHVTQLNILEPLTHEVEGSSVVPMKIKPLHIASVATAALVLAVPLTAYAVTPDAPTQDAPTVVTLPADELAEICGDPVTACYAPRTDPNAIYVSENVTRPDVLAYVIAHETVHFQQHRDNRPFDECEADRLAVERTGYTGTPIYADQCV